MVLLLVTIGFTTCCSPDDRAMIKTAIVEKGLKPAEQAHKAKKGIGWWTDNAFNWNNVCNGGITLRSIGHSR